MLNGNSILQPRQLTASFPALGAPHSPATLQLSLPFASPACRGLGTVPLIPTCSSWFRNLQVHSPRATPVLTICRETLQVT